ncbi:hypothetical protein [Singulisphaera sp. PoT]|uniref:hypothetical protein n=1 Tax=Singulisphaera sp. PoT TaxID=3411797 RepID=UPI003BF516EC
MSVDFHPCSLAPRGRKPGRWALGLCASFIATIFVAAPSFGQPPLSPPKVIVIRPAAEPVPALKYRLTYEAPEQVAGNAVVFYHRALELYLHRRANEKKPGESVEDRISDWLKLPNRDFPRDQAKEALQDARNFLNEVELGTKREDCNWEFTHRDEGFALLLQDIQDTRSLARFVALQIRLEVVEGRVDQAIRWLRVGFVFARHVSNGNSAIQSLVGTAIGRMMMMEMEHLIQVPGAPNLCWAVAGLPRPFIDKDPAIMGERYMLEREIPGLREVDSDVWSLEKARAFTTTLQSFLGMLNHTWAAAMVNSNGLEVSETPSMDDWGKRVVMATMIARSYPEAKRSLIAEGRPAARVEAMPAIQAVTLYSMNLYVKSRDDLFKWLAMPYPLAYRGLEEAERRYSRMTSTSQLGIPFGAILPAMRAFLSASARSERHLSALEVIEAIRLYAASHSGKLPASLDEITEAPIMPDPATNKPFEYKLDGNTATLSAPAIPGESPSDYNTLRYQLKLEN